MKTFSISPAHTFCSVRDSHRVAVRSRFLPPSAGGKGSRISVTHGKGNKSVIISWDYELDTAENHRVAIEQYIATMTWGGEWFIGATDNDGYVAVCVGGVR